MAKLKVGTTILNGRRMEFLERLQLIMGNTNFPVYPLADDKQWNSIREDVKILLQYYKHFLEDRSINLESIEEAFKC